MRQIEGVLGMGKRSPWVMMAWSGTAPRPHASKSFTETTQAVGFLERIGQKRKKSSQNTAKAVFF